ncbi:MAG: site-specific integrase [Cyclobacteriaceae bacterium]
MKSISYYLGKPFKDGVVQANVKALKKAGKPIAKILNEKPTPIYLFLTFSNRKLVRVNTQEKIKPIYWNFDTQSVKPNMHGSLELNDRLQFLKAEVMRQYRKTITINRHITLPQIKLLVESIFADTVPDFDQKPFIEYFREFIEERKLQVNELTTIKYESILNVVEMWMESRKINSKHFYCDNVDEDFEFSFKNYLIEDRKITNNTIAKYLESIKKFMRVARKRGIHSTTAFEDFAINRTKREVIWLEEHELEKLIKCEPDKAHMKRTKLVFMFMIYTGQRYLDYRKMKRRSIVVNADGTMDWELYQRKGTKTTKINIPLIKQAIDILVELGFEKLQPDDYALPVTCNQYMNRAIKDFCEFAGIDSEVTIIKTVGNQRIEQHFKKYQVVGCHTARKSWVSLSMFNGLGMEYITSVTGHQNMKTLRAHYLGLSEKSRREAINNAWSPKE